MFWKDKTKKGKEKWACCEKRRIARHTKKDKKSASEGIIEWADRIIIKVRTNEISPGRGASKSPIPVVIISTLTMLIVLAALFCIYK